jgi:multidrug efflux system membrane fusion protein
MLKYTGTLLATAAICSLTLIGCGADEAPSTPSPRIVRSMLVTDGESTQQAEYTGEIRSRIETDISFQVSGKLIRRAVDVGTIVRPGDVLAAVDSTDQALGVDAARSAVNAARAELEQAQTEEARHRDLLERGLTTRAAHLTQQTAVTTSQARLEQATSDLRLYEQRLSYTTLRADSDGVVTQVFSEVGSVVAPGQPVVRIALPNELEAVFDVPATQIDEFRSDAALRIALLVSLGQSYPARVREISPSADSVTRTYQVRAAIADAPPNLRLGMTVTVMLTRADGSSSIRLPSSALFQSGSDPAVWLIRPELTLELRPVRVDRYESDNVYVAAGLQSGDRVVTAGVHRLADGEKVRLMEAQP